MVEAMPPGILSLEAAILPKQTWSNWKEGWGGVCVGGGGGGGNKNDLDLD